MQCSVLIVQLASIVALLMTLCCPRTNFAEFQRTDRLRKESRRMQEQGRHFFSTPPNQEDRAMQVTGFIDRESFIECREQMLSSDADGNQRLTADEFASFIALRSNGAIQTVFRDLKASFVMLFLTVACLTCVSDTGNDQCCVGNAFIPLSPEDDDLRFLLVLDYICPNVDETIAEAVPIQQSFPPSSTTPSTPVTSDRPPAKPSAEPSPALSGFPTNEPTSEQMPSFKQSQFPSSTPSSVSSSTPSEKTDQRPESIFPSDSPTLQLPTAGPGKLPSSSPSVNRADASSMRPSTSNEMPTLVPVSMPSASGLTASPAQSATGVHSSSSMPSSSDLTVSPAQSATEVPSSSSSHPSATPSIEPSFIPTNTANVSPTTNSTSDKMCVSFAYTLDNTTDYTAEDILSGRNNLIREGLLLATRDVTISILNETQPRPSSSISIDPAERALQLALLDIPIQVGDGRSDEAVSDWMDWTVYPLAYPPLETTIHLRRQPANASPHPLRSRHRTLVRRPPRRQRQLALYLDEYSPTIDAILDSAFCSAGADGCVVVSTTVCVVLEASDTADDLRRVLASGFRESIDSGAFNRAIPRGFLP